MLLFIKENYYQELDDACFNTSHVTLYPNWNKAYACIWMSFNTSHVTLYLNAINEVSDENKFQYISCYSLSLAAMTDVYIPEEFQYISCYSLSHPQRLLQSSGHVSIHLMLLFIGNIISRTILDLLVSIHLMLLFIVRRDSWRECKN